MVKRAIFIHREKKRKKRKGIHSKNKKPSKKIQDDVFSWFTKYSTL